MPANATLLSLTDTSTAVQGKILEYLEAGARRVWIVDPRARTVMVHRPDGSAVRVREGRTLTGEDVLVGLEVDLREVFR